MSNVKWANCLVALAQDARFLLLDEPTSMLGPREVERLIRCVRDLAAGGVGVGLVTHRISEVIGSADRVTVLAWRPYRASRPAKDLDAGAIAHLMIGERAISVQRADRHYGGRERLVASGLSFVEDDVMILDDVSLSVVGGEIVGVAGVAGRSAAGAVVDSGGDTPADRGARMPRRRRHHWRCRKRHAAWDWPTFPTNALPASFQN